MGDAYRYFDPPRDYILNAALQDYIRGLGLVWNSGTSITVKSGACWIPALGRIYEFPSDITVSYTSTTVQWVYVYVYDNAGTPSAEVSTTAPAAPYHGTARYKTGDTTRRYVGALLNGASNLWKFLRQGNRTMYQVYLNQSPFLVLSGGIASTATTISCAGAVPPTTQLATLGMNNNSPNALYIGNPALGTVSSTNFLHSNIAGGSGVGGHFVGPFSLDTLQQFSYIWGTAPLAAAGLYVRVLGFEEDL